MKYPQIEVEFSKFFIIFIASSVVTIIGIVLFEQPVHKFFVFSAWLIFISLFKGKVKVQDA